MSANNHSLFQLGPDTTPYRKLTDEGVRTEEALGRKMLMVAPDALRRLAEQAMAAPSRETTPAEPTALSLVRG